jgi:hypothetical protein
MEFGENPFWALGWIVTGVRATIPQLLANYFPASWKAFTSIWMTKEAHDEHGAIKVRPSEKVRNERTLYE